MNKQQRNELKQTLEKALSILTGTAAHTTTGRFTEPPTEYFGRAMPEAQKEIDAWKNPNKEYIAKGGKNIEYMIKGAEDVDNNIDYHVFFETEEQFNELSPEMQKLIRYNWNKSLMYSTKRCRLWPLYDFNNYPIPGHYFWNLGNYTLFTEDDRDQKVDDLMDVKSAIEYWVTSESQKHKPWPPKD